MISYFASYADDNTPYKARENLKTKPESYLHGLGMIKWKAAQISPIWY